MLKVVTITCLHSRLNVDTPEFLLHSFVSARRVLALKSAGCVYVTHALLCSYLYSVILHCILLPFAATVT